MWGSGTCASSQAATPPVREAPCGPASVGVRGCWDCGTVGGLWGDCGPTSVRVGDCWDCGAVGLWDRGGTVGLWDCGGTVGLWGVCGTVGGLWDLHNAEHGPRGLVASIRADLQQQPTSARIQSVGTRPQ
eukprot:1194316-Prorocentrum_minimum.AAC.6